MIYDLPKTVCIDGEEYKIRKNCDYRVVLDCMEPLSDDNLTADEKIFCAFVIFYEDYEKIQNYPLAVKEMFKIINGGEEPDEEQPQKPPLMNWQQDFKIIIAPINRVLGYSVRAPEKYTHWFDFLAAYMEIGDCTFANVVSIRNKLSKGIKLEKSEQEFYKENRKMVDLRNNEALAWLNEVD